MQAVVWSDYLCPWCYLGRDRTALLESLGVSVTPLPYDLHPELPAAAVASHRTAAWPRCTRGSARSAPRSGSRSIPPSTSRARASRSRAGEVVRGRRPDAFAALDAALFDAVFVTGEDIGDPDVLAEVVSRAGVDGGEVVDAVARGEGADEVRASIDAAHEVGVTGTPAWLLDGRLLIPGVQDRETIEHWVARG